MRILGVEPEAFHQLAYVVGSGTAAVLPFRRGTVDRLPGGLKALVATGDLQGVVRGDALGRDDRWLGTALAEELQLLRARGEIPSVRETAVLLTGDLQPSADVADVRSVWRSLGATCRWVAGVAGNHDAFGTSVCAADVPPRLGRENLHFFDGHIAQLDGLTIAGLSGVIGNAGGPWVRSEAGFVAALEPLVDRLPDVLLLHDGPNVAGTKLPGWPRVRQVLESAAPCLVFRGHDPWSAMTATLSNGTQVENVEESVAVLTIFPQPRH